MSKLAAILLAQFRFRHEIRGVGVSRNAFACSAAKILHRSKTTLACMWHRSVMSKTGVYGVVTVVQRVGAGLLACGIGREALAADDTARVDLSLPQAVAVGGGTGTAPADTGEVTVKSGIAAYFADWENRANRAQAEQPHWATPLVTVTPLLIQQVRFDTYVEHAGNGADITNLDNGKGLELIPTEMNEVQIGLPPYVIRTNPNGRGQVAGFNDWPFLLVKQRLASANEQNGNYILTLYLRGRL